MDKVRPKLEEAVPFWGFYLLEFRAPYNLGGFGFRGLGV